MIEHIDQIDRYFILDEQGEPVPERDQLAWDRWMNANFDRRRVAIDDLPGGVRVITVFLGGADNMADMLMYPNDPKMRRPLLYSTAVQHNGEWDEERAYASRVEALAGHAEVVQRLLESAP